MSLLFRAAGVCPACHAEVTLDYPSSVNADRRPDLRAAILDRSLYTAPCADCARSLVFEPHMSYLHLARGQWILAEAVREVGNWKAAEADALALFDLAFGGAAPEPAQAIGRRLVPRLVFGWPALVEKLLCEENCLDDAALEAMKLAVLREGPLRTLSPARELRLTGVAENTLSFAWLDPATGQQVEQLTVPEALYVRVKAGGDAWAPLIAAVAGPMFVDTNRLLRAPPPTG